MEINKLQGIVLMLFFIGMILGVGILTLDSYSRAVRTSTSFTDGEVNISSGAATLSQTYCSAITAVINNSGSTYSISTFNVTITDADTCAISADLPTSELFNISFTYGASTEAQAVADASVTAVQPIAATWMPLIVTVIILSIILTLVIGSFAGRR